VQVGIHPRAGANDDDDNGNGNTIEDGDSDGHTHGHGMDSRNGDRYSVRRSQTRRLASLMLML